MLGWKKLGMHPIENVREGDIGMRKEITYQLILLLVSVLASGCTSPTNDWAEILPASERFEVLYVPCTPLPDRPCPFPPIAWGVLDKETGLIWEKRPSGKHGDWYDAVAYCYRRSVGGRMGWRLPTIEELTSLLDPNKKEGIALPDGHPFSNIQSTTYWSATTLADTSTSQGEKAWRVYMGSSAPYPSDFEVSPNSKLQNGCFWCVRGGQGYDGAILPWGD